MRRFAFQNASWVMVTYASCLHYAWAVILVVTGLPVQVTPVWGMSVIVTSPYWLAVIFAVLATAAIVGGRYLEEPWGFLLMLPQQTVLIISALGVLTAVMRGMYADGTIRPELFILADQIPALIAPPLYTVAILDVYRRKYHR